MFLVGSIFSTLKLLAAEMSVKDFITLLINIGVIPANKIAAVNAYLATLDSSKVTAATLTDIATLNSKWIGKTVTADQTKINYKVEGYIKYFQDDGGLAGCGVLPDGRLSSTPCPPQNVPTVFISTDRNLIDYSLVPETRSQIASNGTYNGKLYLVADVSGYKGTLFSNWDSDSTFIINVLQKINSILPQPSSAITPLTLKYIFTVHLTGLPLTPFSSIPLAITDITVVK